jgi:uncharacterized YccA/Bax inhibitor family protein
VADLMRTSNPALNAKAFQGEGVGIGEAMTLKGTINKTGLLLLCVVGTAAWTWNVFMNSGNAQAVLPMLLVGGIGGFIFALITIFKKTWAPVTAPIYALLEGLVLGGISAMFEMRYHGIAIQAVSSGLIPVTENFKLGIFAATGGIALFYVAQIVLGLFGIHFTTINGSGPIGIAFSVFVVIVAALNLVLDFDFIENAVKAGAPKYMEWYGAFGLMVTLIWLYLEILRLLSKLRSRD